MQGPAASRLDICLLQDCHPRISGPTQPLAMLVSTVTTPHVSARALMLPAGTQPQPTIAVRTAKVPRCSRPRPRIPRFGIVVEEAPQQGRPSTELLHGIRHVPPVCVPCAHRCGDEVRNPHDRSHSVRIRPAPIPDTTEQQQTQVELMLPRAFTDRRMHVPSRGVPGRRKHGTLRRLPTRRLHGGRIICRD